MIETLRIEGYRGFERFEMAGLGRINLLVGRNNAGKTSVLEAIRLLATVTGAPAELPAVIWSLARRRDEVVAHHARLRFMFHRGATGPVDDIRISDLSRDARFRIGEGEGDSAFSVSVRSTSNEPKLAPMAMSWELVDRDAMLRPADVSLYDQEGWSIPPVLGPDLLDPEELVLLFGRVVLGPDEDRLTEALRLIDPRIRRLAATSGDFPQLMVKLDGFSERLPLGNLGGGLARFAQLWLTLALAGKGPLLVDEIDSGLHHSVMVEMWRHLWRLAIERDIQVFATTHGWDCVSALGMMSHADKVPADEVTLHRIEPAKGRSVRYSAERILFAAEEGIEVR